MLQEQRLGELWKSRKGLPTKMVPKQSLEVGLEANSQREGGRLFQVGKYTCRGRSGSYKACGRAKEVGQSRPVLGGQCVTHSTETAVPNPL